MKDKKYTYSNLELLQECPNCGMLLNINKKKCTHCNKSLVYNVPKGFENFDIDKIYSSVRTFFGIFEDFINKKINVIYPFDYNGAYTKIIEETIKNPTKENKDRLISLTDYCKRMNRVLYEMGLDWESFEKNENFNKTVSDINLIANRDNCLRPILYPNDEDLDDSEYYEWKKEYNSFKSFETIKEEVSQEEEPHCFTDTKSQSKETKKIKEKRIKAKQYYIAWYILEKVTETDIKKRYTKKYYQDIGSKFSKGKIDGNTFYKQVALVKDVKEIITNSTELELFFDSKWKETIIDLCENNNEVINYLNSLK